MTHLRDLMMRKGTVWRVQSGGTLSVLSVLVETGVGTSAKHLHENAGRNY